MRRLIWRYPSPKHPRRQRLWRRLHPKRVQHFNLILESELNAAIERHYKTEVLAQLNATGPLLGLNGLFERSFQKAEDMRWEALGLEPIDWHAE